MTAAGSVDLLEGSNEDSQELPRTSSLNDYNDGNSPPKVHSII
jgi:hypothetical protein